MDKVVRVIIDIVAGVLNFTGTVTGIWGYVALGVGAIILMTARMSRCSLCSIFGWSSCPFESENE